jgi:hypothetical protein
VRGRDAKHLIQRGDAVLELLEAIFLGIVQGLTDYRLALAAVVASVLLLSSGCEQ